MKHLLNNLSQEEKNSIREQHEGGRSIDTSKFKKLVESTLGDVKPLINEQATSNILILTIYLPQTKDDKGNLIDKKVGMAKYLVSASKSPDDTTGKSFTTDDYSGIKGIFINEMSATQVTTKKDAATGNISGTFTLTDKLYAFLQPSVGKGKQTSQKVYCNVTLTNGGTTIKYAEWQVVYYTSQPTQK